ncbi:hypothetical protein RUM43_012991 [Polyplax serrata]|uniref:Uncharacterized protein n=1 Tax=Polyplax serrata TaxID=468196 RepID=A0AAN8P5T7_POLSC
MIPLGLQEMLDKPEDLLPEGLYARPNTEQLIGGRAKDFAESLILLAKNRRFYRVIAYLNRDCPAVYISS